jgi:hypothetical protein
VQDVALLLEALLGELDAARNFEMAQALLARVLVVSCSLQQWFGLMLHGLGQCCSQLLDGTGAAGARAGGELNKLPFSSAASTCRTKP